MIQHEKQYLEFIQKRGVGANDHVASSPDSYISYLRSVATLIGQEITPSLLKSEEDINNIVQKITSQREPKTIRNYCSAMRRYVEFVLELKL
ncbi:hypothetical protein QLH52_15375 [Methylomonas sp. OY6]|uniref:Core-binding (CB) domain-containing protein n=1 Tax=Methylomonas defluvii TaxID=3045149 RepID=A0ABU4UGR2_9GAMM|nr:hypothetical protein [Methylomonas sp. OY6]MDX8128675.1 hypothetical protein [Methylomonas sp. OY6]